MTSAEILPSCSSYVGVCDNDNGDNGDSGDSGDDDVDAVGFMCVCVV